MKVAGRYFPEEYRAFCHGALSACVERFGGINSISLLDIDEHEGKLYPDRLAIPLFSRRGTSSDRPLFSSPLRFYRESENGANISFVPEYADLLPFGFTSKQYSFLMRENSIAVKLEPESSDKSVFCTVSKMHFMTGIFPSMKNQLSGSASNIQWLPFKYRGEDFKQDLPFKDTPLEMAMPEITWLKSKGVLQIVWDLKWEDHAKKLFMCIAADAPIEASEHDALWRLTFKSAGKSCAFGFGIAYTAKEALKRSYESCVGFDSEMKMELELQTFPDAIAMEVESIPQASEFTRVFPAFQHNMMLAKTEHETAIRAATDKFGYFCMWDQVYPTRDFLICGTPENAKRSLRYLCGYPGMKYSSWISMHMIITMNEYLAFVDDSEFLAEIYPRGCINEQQQFSALQRIEY